MDLGGFWVAVFEVWFGFGVVCLFVVVFGVCARGDVVRLG